MANTTFAGAIAEQNYQWEYTCEFCGRRVEKIGKLTASYGFGRNVNTRWNVNAAWSQEAIAQAERKLAEAKAQAESLSQSGHWAPSGDDGKCPYCGKYQHWSNAAREAVKSREAPDGQAKRKRLSLRAIGEMPSWYLFMAFIIAMLACLLPYLGMSIFHAEPGTPIVLPIVLVSLAISVGLPLLVVKLILLRKNRRSAEIRQSLEGVQQTMPRLISWGFRQSYVKGVNPQ